MRSHTWTNKESRGGLVFFESKDKGCDPLRSPTTTVDAVETYEFSCAPTLIERTFVTVNQPQDVMLIQLPASCNNCCPLS